jgi:hypothetical protein
MLVNIQEWNPALFSFRDPKQSTSATGTQRTSHTALYNGTLLALFCFNIKSSGIQRNQQPDGSFKFGCAFYVDERLRLVLESIYKKAQAIYPYCQNPVYQNRKFGCFFSNDLQVNYPLGVPFSANASIKIFGVFSVDNVSRLHFEIGVLSDVVMEQRTVQIPSRVQPSIVIQGSDICMICSSVTDKKISYCLHSSLCVSCSQRIEDNHRCSYCL